MRFHPTGEDSSQNKAICVWSGVRALGDLHLDARPREPVGEAQSADAAADDENAEGFDHDARIINQTDE